MSDDLMKQETLWLKVSGYVGYSYADEYRTTLAELLKERSDEKGQDDE